LIRIARLGLAFGEKKIFEDLDLEIESGLCFGIGGCNGKGKTSLLYLIKGIIPNLIFGSITGEITVGGESPRDRLLETVGIMLDEFEEQVTGSTVEYEIGFPLENQRLPGGEIEKRINHWLSVFGLIDKRDQDPWTLSGGELQRLVLATVLAQGAEILLLDEPTSNLDPKGRAELRQLIKQIDKTVIIADHDPGLLLGMDRILHLGERPTVIPARELEHLQLEGIRPFQQKRFPPQPTSGETVLEVRGLRKKKGDFQLNIDHLKVGRGELIAITGMNGAGKTTLARLLAGIDRPDSGRVMIDHQDGESFSRSDRARKISYLDQNPDHQIFAPKVWDEVRFGVRNLGLDEEFARLALETVGLSDRKDSDPFLLPKGDRQLVALASTLALRPEIIIFDEPTTGLDFPGIQRIMDLILRLNREGHTIIIITHALWLIRWYIPRVVLMASGRIVEDGPTDRVLSGYAGDDSQGLD